MEKYKPLIAIILIIAIFFIAGFLLSSTELKYSQIDNTLETTSNYPTLSLLQGNCQTTPPFDVCYESSINKDGLLATAKIESFQNPKSDYGAVGDLFVKKAYIETITTGTQGYYTDKCFSSWSEFWKYASCSGTGCTGNKIPLINRTEFTKSYTGCLVYYAWDFKTGTNSMGESTYLWKSQAYGWLSTNKLKVNIIDCLEDNQCSIGQVCEQTKCVVAECFSGETKCDGVRPLRCQNNKWIETPLQIGTCGVECTNDLDCRQEVKQEKICKNNKLYEVEYLPQCQQNNTCGVLKKETTIKECDLGCANINQCLEDQVQPTEKTDYSPYIIIIVMILLIIVGGVLWMQRQKQ